uniref:Uncharacterized protein n=1 Tax=Trypanosoma congolense (strain IL3000) TaxID=1068625 RepID=G0UQT5_TRYCI|nr:hypothetical protein, unlikely [Trypanosoma congolense IL3000]
MPTCEDNVSISALPGRKRNGEGNIINGGSKGERGDAPRVPLYYMAPSVQFHVPHTHFCVFLLMEVELNHTDDFLKWNCLTLTPFIVDIILLWWLSLFLPRFGFHIGCQRGASAYSYRAMLAGTCLFNKKSLFPVVQT